MFCLTPTHAKGTHRHHRCATGHPCPGYLSLPTCCSLPCTVRARHGSARSQPKELVQVENNSVFPEQSDTGCICQAGSVQSINASAGTRQETPLFLASVPAMTVHTTQKVVIPRSPGLQPAQAMPYCVRKVNEQPCHVWPGGLSLALLQEKGSRNR